MENQEAVNMTVEEFAKHLNLEVVFPGNGEMTLSTYNVNRPGLQLAGYFDYFGANRVQVMGNAEASYYNAKPESHKIMIMDMLLSRQVPCVIVCNNLPIEGIFIESFRKHNIPLFRSSLDTSLVVNNLVIYLNEILAPTATMHGVLMDVTGMGVLLTGHSGIGKSETALELVKRGHRLVADDAVIVKKVDNQIVGSSPEIIRYFMEIRGIGIVDVRSIYGIGATVDKKQIDLVVEMEHWDKDKMYDRLGGKNLYEEILGIYVPKLVMPITPGRNLPIIIEAAAINHSLHLDGYDATSVLIDRTLGAAKKNR